MLYFSGIVFLIILASVSIMAYVVFFMLRHGFFIMRGPDQYPTGSIWLLLIISLLVGTTISFFVGVKIIRPVAQLTEALKRVADGDFNVTVTEDGNIEEVNEMARNFNTMVRELSGIETLRNDFIVNVSHEFKTPIAAIEGYATLLLNNDLSIEERNEYANIILDSSKQLSSLSGNILKLSKLENQEIVLNKEIFRLDEQIRQAILLLEKEWINKNLKLNIDLFKINCYGDQSLFMQVWLNLIGNAVKFTETGDSISITSSIVDKYMIVEISDTGCGMNEDTRLRIFDKFYQGDTTRKTEGNGLGLTLVKSILDLCNGTIEVSSSPGFGSSFKVALPIRS